MKNIKFRSTILLFTGIFSSSLFNLCTGQSKKLSYSDVFGNRHSKIMGQMPAIEGWLDEQNYLIWEANEKNKKVILQKIEVKTGEVQTLVDFSQVYDRFNKGQFFTPWEAHNQDYTGFIIRFQDNLYYFGPSDGSILQLTNSDSKENNPTFSPNGEYIAFTRDHDLYIINTKTGVEQRLTNDGADIIYNGYASWVYYEEILGRSSNYRAFWWSPDSKMISFLRFDDSPVPEFPIFHCEGIHGYLEIQRYPLPGDRNPSVRLGVVRLEDKQIKWLDSNNKADYYIAWPFWTVDSKNVLYQSVNRGQDKIQIYKSNLQTGDNKIIYEERQSSWINFFEDLYLLKDGSGFLLRSDKSGWWHLYLYDLDGNLIQRITQGDWNVDKICQVDEKNQEIFFQGFIDNSMETHLFVVNFEGAYPKKLTRIKGTHKTKVAPTGNYFIDTVSNIYHPQKTFLADKKGKLVRLLGNRNSSTLQTYDLGKTEIFKIPTEDGIELPALWILPPDFDKSRKYPVIFQIYGGPGRANVKNQFRSLSDQYLVQNDIIVFTVDHRGSYHFGKKGQSLMHRNLGKWEMNDYICAVKWLKSLPFIDQNRIGIMGGSYGGYVVAMALTYGAEYFTHGVALYPVTDWQLYDNFYTERFMDTPNDNPEGYTFSSVLNHADNYQGKMLIIHGAIDDNVHMQNTTQLIQVLQKLDKYFELMIYPNQKHGTRGAWRKHSNRETFNFWFRHFLGKELDLQQ